MRLRNQGYSLMELIVVVAIVGLMGLGTTTLVTNMLKLNKKTLVKNNLINVRELIEANLKNDTAWGFTYCMGNDPSAGGAPCGAVAPNNLNCLYEGDNIPCNHDELFTNPVIYNRNGDIIYDPSDAAAGFSLESQPCNSFGTPDDNCPFRYDIDIRLTCPGAQTTCLKPDIGVVATASISTASVTSLANRIVLSDYLLDFKREQAVIYEPLEVVFQLGGPAGSGGGNCTDLTPRNRPFNRLVHDVGGNILNPADFPAQTGRVRLRAGLYDCEVLATAWEAFGGFTIEITVNGASVAMVGSGFSGAQSSAIVVGNASLDLAADSWVRVQHTCGAGSASTVGPTELGIPVPNYASPTVLTRLSCVRKR